MTLIQAMAGAVGFLTRIPLGHSERGWEAFRRHPEMMVVIGYPLGGLIALAVLIPGPPETAAVLFPVWIIAMTGITHIDGIADCGDAAVIHGDSEQRYAVLKDSTLGVGGTVAIVLVIVGLVAAGRLLAAMPPAKAIIVVLAAEVGAKATVAGLVSVGTAAHDGLGSALTRPTRPRRIGVIGLAVAPVIALTTVTGSVIWTFSAAVSVGVGMLIWARRTLGGVSGDVFGATNEVARLAGLHAGVIGWTLL